MQGTKETWVQSLGQEDRLEEEMTTRSSSLAWRIPWTEEPGGLQPMGCQRVRHYRSDLAHTHEVLKGSIHVHHSGNDHRKCFHFQTGEGWQLRPTAGELKRDAGLFVSPGSWEDVAPVYLLLPCIITQALLCGPFCLTDTSPESFREHVLVSVSP